jgi:RND family efflux transporter MFP subunit
MVAAVAGGLVWWRGRAQAEKSGSSALAPAHVVRRDFRASVLATGAVRPKVGAEVKVGARITGKLDRLHANVGDMVERGQVIGELQKADLEATVAQRSAEAAVSAARISDAEARLRLAELELQRQQQLIAQDFTSQQAVDNAVRDREVAAASLLLAERQRDAAIAAQREAEVKLSYATIVAPIAGVVGSVSTQEGETVAAGLNAPTFVTVIDLRRLQVDAYVDEVDIGKVRSGQKAVFTVDAFPGREFAGEVAAIYPKAVIQDNVVNYDVVIEISTPFGGLLRPDMTASVTITLDERKGVLAVPAAAVVRERGKTLVRVVRGDRSEAREITVGWKDGGWVEVVRGLTEGETVLLEASGNDKEAIR